MREANPRQPVHHRLPATRGGVDTIPFDAAAARVYGRIYAAVVGVAPTRRSEMGTGEKLSARSGAVRQQLGESLASSPTVDFGVIPAPLSILRRSTTCCSSMS